MKNIALVLIIIQLCSCNNRAPLHTGLEGNPLPSFNLLLHDSTTYINTGNTPAEKPVVLFYFSPECPYCRAQMDEIIQNNESMKNIQFYIFTTWPFAEMREFYKHYRLDKYSNMVVGVDYTNFFKYHFKVVGIPYMAIYKKDKNLKEAYLGNINSSQIKRVAEN